MVAQEAGKGRKFLIKVEEQGCVCVLFSCCFSVVCIKTDGSNHF